jgi:hypothetical protein
VAFLGPTVKLAAGEAEEMVGVELVLGDKEVGAVVGMLGLAESAPGIRAETVIESSTSKGELGGVRRREVLGD